MSAATLLCCAIVTQPAEVPRHLAETVHAAEVSNARKKYLAEVQAANRRLKSALEKASADAQRNGQLVASIAYRERAKAIQKPDPPTALVGKYEIEDDKEQLIFDEDGNVALAINPLGKQPVRWIYNGERIYGFAYWPDEQMAHVYDIRGTKVVVTQYPKSGSTTAVASKVR